MALIEYFPNYLSVAMALESVFVLIDGTYEEGLAT